ncbi:MAG TPA: tetratricopeptide repeat protein, partial [Thermoanaerobaculia bacterium]|nr:tetratricopeptide repeat protein [Thermoanaerobaculia bacterium]
PNFADAWSTLGSIDLALGNTGEGQSALTHSLQIKPDGAVEARLDVIKGDLAAAEGKFEQAVQSKPDDPAIRNDYAAVLARLGKNDEARSQYEEALRLRPNFYDARMNYGALLSRLGDNERAAQQFSEAARLQPNSPEPHVYLALLEANGRQFAEAAQNIQQAIAINHDGSNRMLINAIRIPARPTAIDEYLAFLRQQSAGH